MVDQVIDAMAAMQIGDNMKVKVGDNKKGEGDDLQGPITMTNGHSHKVCGKWYLPEELQVVPVPSDDDLRLAMSWQGPGKARKVQEVQKLLEAKANPNALSKHGESALHHAAKIGQVAMMELLIQAKADPNTSFDRQDNPLLFLSVAAAVGPAQFQDFCRDDGDGGEYQKGTSHAVAVVELLLQAKADANRATARGNFPLYLAAERNTAENQLAVVKLLVSAGADVNKLGDNGYSPLAVTKKNSPVFEVLKNAGAKIIEDD